MFKRGTSLMASIVALPMALVLVAALFVLTGGQAHAQSMNGGSGMANFAFTALITKGANTNTAITGGLNVNFNSPYYCSPHPYCFHGNLHEPDGTQISVSGELKDGNFNITFYNAEGQPIIKGVGTQQNNGELVGTFNYYKNNYWVASGIWSAYPVANPSDVLALAFWGKTKHGPDAGTLYTGAIVLNKETLTGTFNLPDGTVANVSAMLEQNNISVVFDLGGGMKIFGIGVPYSKDNMTGFKGPFVGHMQGDEGYWHAFFFQF